MPEFVFLIREDASKKPSPEIAKEIVRQFIAWAGKLRAEGKFKGGDEIQLNGRIVSLLDGKIVDTQFTPSSDAVAGYFLIEAADYDDAVAIAKDCPGLHYGDSVEIRQISDYQ